MYATGHALPFGIAQALGLDGVVQVDDYRGWPEHVTAFAVEVVRSDDTDRHNGNLQIAKDSENPYLKWNDSTVQGSLALRKNNQTGPAVQRPLGLLNQSPQAPRGSLHRHRDVSESFH